MPLFAIELILNEDVLQALVISVELEGDFIKVVAPNLESKDHSCQLQIVCQIIPLVVYQVSECICYHSPPLHQHAAKFDTELIAVRDLGWPLK